MKPLLLFDANCGFCSLAAGLVPRLKLPVTVTAMQSVDLEGVGVSTDRASVEMPLVRADGTVVYGHAAVAAALSTGALPLRAIARLLVARPFDRMFKRVYAWVARHRHRLPGGTAACALPLGDTSSPDQPNAFK